MKSDRKGYFGEFGGQYVPETLMHALGELDRAYEDALKDETFMAQYRYYLKMYSGRPTPLYYADRMTKDVGGAKIYLKREDLNHTGAHKINNVMGQILLARRMGKRRIIAETGAGQHGLATATVAAMFDMPCEIFMGEEDIKRQALNVFKMELLGAQINSVKSGTGTLKDATNEAIRHWVACVKDTYYVIGSVVGPHPYPSMVRDFQRVIGDETREQILALEGRLPDHIIACVGGGSNAMGIFYPFIRELSVRLHGVEGGGLGIETQHHAIAVEKGRVGVVHGMKTYLLQDEYGNISPAHSISAGLDYPGVGPQHAYLYESGRVEYSYVTDDEAISAFRYLSTMEGIIPAIESAHAIAYGMELAAKLNRRDIIILNISGRGDKDVETVFKTMREVLV